MVRRPPARRSTSASSVVRKKASSSYSPKKRRSQAASTTATKRSTAAKRSHSRITQIFIRLVSITLGIVILLGGVGYFVLQTIRESANQLPSQTVVLVPAAVAETPQQAWVVQLEKDVAESTILSLDADTKVQVPGGYGEYRLEAVYPLLTLEEKDDTFIRGSYSQSLGVVVDQVIPIQTTHISSDSIHSQLLLAAWRWLWQQDMASLSYIKVWLLLQREPVLTMVQSLPELAKLSNQAQTSRRTLQECSVGILNGSATAGAAGRISELLETAKILTIRVGTYPTPTTQTKLYHSGRAECLPVLERVQHVLLTELEPVVDASVTTQYRAAIVLVLGEDSK